MEVPKREVVVGDIVMLNTGNEVPADGELLEAMALQVDESSLTGEPICHKTTDPAEFDDEATFPSNQVLRGTGVKEGTGVYRVTAVGDATENGKVFEAAQIDSSVKTPLNEQLERLGSMISKISYGIAALIVIGRLVIFFSSTDAFSWIELTTYLLETLMLAVTLVVVSVPEGLPMAVTLSLAYSMRRMLKTNNLVRKMHACETMGATTVICTDKTGTLTQNKMTVNDAQFFALDAQGLGGEMGRLIVEGVAVNSTATLDRSNPQSPKVLGNPTEGALLTWLQTQSIDYKDVRKQYSIISQEPFSTETKFMSTVVEHRATGRRFRFVKGAPEIVMSMCRSIVGTMDRAAIEEQLLQYQSRAMRTLGFAYKVLDANDSDAPYENGGLSIRNLTFLGICAISDPVRSDVPRAVGACQKAGIDIKIVTGDTPATAREIARQIGIWNNSNNDDHRCIITGPDFEALSDDEASERVKHLKIMCRARPTDKQRLVQLLQAQDAVVAVTGDGTNDAPALKAAQVGLSMGDGTSVAKEASDITILDNSFSSIVQAVMWGRSLYKNIQRFLLFQLTINVVACAIVLLGSLIGTSSPLTITQMLWVNLIMDTFAAGALASLPPNWSVMRDKPRKSGKNGDFIINRSMALSIFGIGLIFTIVLLGLLLYMKGDGNLSATELTWFFTYFVMLQVWNLFNAKAFMTGHSAFANLKQSQSFVWVALLIIVGQYIIVTFGGKMFNVVPLSTHSWLMAFVLSVPVLVVGEIGRLAFSKNKK
jgi:Ca2+-transporting ATPase